MTETEFDWSEVSGTAVKRLRAPKVAPVHDTIKALAQKSRDGVADPENPEGERLHVLRHEFKSPEMAAEFAKQIKKAGPHTVPPSTVTPVIDPDNTGNTRLVAWKAGDKRGRAATV